MSKFLQELNVVILQGPDGEKGDDGAVGAVGQPVCDSTFCCTHQK